MVVVAEDEVVLSGALVFGAEVVALTPGAMYAVLEVAVCSGGSTGV